jgi:serine/threonine protein kinase
LTAAERFGLCSRPLPGQPMHITKQPNVEPLPGYRLLEPLGSGGFGEVWKCEAPGGLYKAIKFVPATSDNLIEGPCRSTEELRAIQRIKDIRHPFLLSMERVEVANGELCIVMELADQSLDDLLTDSRAGGKTGLPRDEILRYLTEAAEVLDLMNQEYGLQHLDVKPRNLFLVRGHVKVADFGLVQSLGETATSGQGSLLSAVTPLYASPELFRGAISQQSDQYSLAIVFQELLTGELPFSGKNARQLMFLHSTEKPGLEPLPPADRLVIARALSKDPEQRFPSCTDLVRALRIAGDSGPRKVVRARPSAQGRLLGDTKGGYSGATTQLLGPAEARALPDYQFLSCLSRDPLGEVWEAQTVEGKRRLVKFLYVAGGVERREQEALLHLQTLRHPALLPVTVVPAAPGCLAVVTDLVESSLRSRFQEWQTRGERGIPRPELLALLQSAAESLDILYQQHGVQHLELNPSRLLLDGRRVLFGDFGLAQLLWVPASIPIGQAQMRYSAPELAQGLITRSCDQYSLAVIYQELLTGHHPFRGRIASARSAKVRKLTGKESTRRTDGPNLEALPAQDREVVARALETNPERRFATCLEFVRALKTAGGDPLLAETQPLPDAGVNGKASRDLVARLFQEAREMCRPCRLETHTRSGPSGDEGEESREGRFLALLPPAGAIRKFEGFRQHWGARLVSSAEASAVFEVGHKRRTWLPWRDRSRRLLVEVQWSRSHGLMSRMPEVVVRVRQVPGSGVSGRALLEETGPRLIESLQGYLLGNPERRNEERVIWPHTVGLTYVVPTQGRTETVECQGKDLSLAGIGLYLPVTLPTAQVRLHLSSPTTPEPVLLTGSVVRVQRWDDQLFEAGVVFDC